VQPVEPPDHYPVPHPFRDVFQQSLVLRSRLPPVVSADVIVDVHLSNDPSAPRRLVFAVCLLPPYPQTLTRRIVGDAAVYGRGFRCSISHLDSIEPTQNACRIWVLTLRSGPEGVRRRLENPAKAFKRLGSTPRSRVSHYKTRLPGCNTGHPRAIRSAPPRLAPRGTEANHQAQTLSAH
jgi:hypothetical protein